MKNDCTVRKYALSLLLILVIIALFPSCQDKKEPQIPIRVSFYDGPKLIETKEDMPDSDILLPDPPEKSGYVFSGWSLDGKMISLSEKTISLPPSEKEYRFSASWEKKPMTVSFYSEGSLYKENTACLHGEEYQYPDVPERDGYSFSGWMLNGDTVVNPEETEYSLIYSDSGYRYDALWTPLSFPVKFYVDDVLHRIIETKTDEVFSLPESPSKYGFIFNCWIDSGMTELKGDETSLPYKQDGYAFNAIWEKKPMTVSFYLDGKLWREDKSVLADETLFFPSPEEKHGYAFSGWKMGDDPKINPGGSEYSLPYSESGYRYDAQWQAKTMEISFKQKIGVSTTYLSSIVVTESEEYQMPLISEPGYVVEWVDDFTGEVLDIKSGNTHSSTYNESGYTYVAKLIPYIKVSQDGLVEKAEGIDRITELTIPEKIGIIEVTGIKAFGFNKCESIKSITIPSFISNIPPYAFSGCTSLESVMIMEGPDSIGHFAFVNCHSLRDVRIPNSVQSLSYGAFDGCTNIEDISLSGDITEFVFNQDNPALFSSNTVFRLTVNDGSASFSTLLGEAVKNNIHTLILPESVKTISDGAFSGSTSLLSVSFSEGLEKIGDEAFMNCKEIKKIVLPESINEIGMKAFLNCSNLESIDLKSVGSIGQAAFKGCIALKSITLPESLKAIEDSLFDGCMALESVTMGRYSETIGIGAFRNCTNLSSISFPESLLSIANYAFSRSVLSGNLLIPGSVTSIGDNAFSFTGIESLAIENGTECTIGISSFAHCGALKEISIGNHVRAIGNEAFKDCTDLKSVSLSGSIEDINPHAFNECSGISLILRDGTTTIKGAISSFGEAITSVQIPQGVETIEEGAFRGCKNLSEITIPSSVIEIGNNAFDHCFGLNSITIMKEENSISGSPWGLTNEKIISWAE